MILAASIIVAVIFIKLFANYREWLKHRPIKHRREWWMVVAASLYPIYLFMEPHALPFYFSAPLSAIMVAGFIWFWFDGLYNVIRGYDWFFTGTEDKDDAATDNFLQSIPKWQQVFVKFSALLLPLIIYIITFK